MNDKTTEKWIRYCRSMCTQQEREAIEEELAGSEELRKQMELLRQAIVAGDDLREMERIDVDMAYQHTRGAITNASAKARVNAIMRYAAILFLPLLVATMWLGYTLIQDHRNTVAQSNRDMEIKSASGLVIRYVLPDGSVVWLNSNSRLHFPQKFEGDERRVDLVGEAYFEVKADRKRPFYVKTPSGLTVYVYGTKFDVSAYPGDDQVETVLESGHVGVITPDNRKAELLPGEGMTYNVRSGSMGISRVDVYEHTAWKDGKLVFRNMPLEEVLKKLSYHYNTDITLDNPHGRVYRYRATFYDETLPQILDYLMQSTRMMRWEMTDSSQLQNGTLTRRRVTVHVD